MKIVTMRKMSLIIINKMSSKTIKTFKIMENLVMVVDELKEIFRFFKNIIFLFFFKNQFSFYTKDLYSNFKIINV